MFRNRSSKTYNNNNNDNIPDVYSSSSDTSTSSSVSSRLYRKYPNVNNAPRKNKRPLQSKYKNNKKLKGTYRNGNKLRKRKHRYKKREHTKPRYRPPLQQTCKQDDLIGTNNENDDSDDYDNKYINLSHSNNDKVSISRPIATNFKNETSTNTGQSEDNSDNKNSNNTKSCIKLSSPIKRNDDLPSPVSGSIHQSHHTSTPSVGTLDSDNRDFAAKCMELQGKEFTNQMLLSNSLIKNIDETIPEWCIPRMRSILDMREYSDFGTLPLSVRINAKLAAKSLDDKYELDIEERIDVFETITQLCKLMIAFALSYPLMLAILKSYPDDMAPRYNNSNNINFIIDFIFFNAYGDSYQRNNFCKIYAFDTCY